MSTEATVALPKTFYHPTFGPCDVIPTLIAIRWKKQLDEKLRLVTEAVKVARTPPRRSGCADELQPKRNVDLDHRKKTH